MNTPIVASLLLCGFAAVQQAAAQGAGPALLQEVVAVREALVRDNMALHQYTWTENTEVRIKNDVKSSTNVICRYDAWHKLERRPLGESNSAETPKATSKRPMNRKKADMADYVERAVSLVHTYLPPNPEQLQFLMQTGKASLGQAASGQAQIQFQNYYQDGDSLTFTFDPKSKALLKVAVKSYLVTPKDQVTMDAVFETLPDGANHLASSVLNATAKKIQVKTQNSSYQKLAAK